MEISSVPRAPCVRLTQLLHGADEGGRALELLRREQAQGVAHEDVDTIVARVLQAPVEDRECRQRKVRLSLAAASRKEDQLDVLTELVVLGGRRSQRG